MSDIDTQSWIKALQDTGKTNNLVNYKHYKSSTIDVIYPDAEKVFGKITSQAKLQIYDPRLGDDDFEREEAIRELRQENISTIEEYRDHFKGLISKSNEILLYNEKLDPWTAIRSAMSNSNLRIEETGVNTLYMTFGLLHWKEVYTAESYFEAPILLIPVVIENDSRSEPFFVRALEEDVTLNPTLAFKLKNEFGISLPEYEDDNLYDYLNKIKDIVKVNFWLVSDEVRIGSFSFQKLNMYNDIKDNEEYIKNCDSIKRLFGNNERDYESENQEYSEQDTENITGYDIVDLHSVVDCDSSQIEAIKLAKKGESFVLQGPPGTGKSQTITNIIAECLYDGKTVLFVSEKQAALNVVYDKLKQNELSDFCLELHSHKANKKEVVTELSRCLNLIKGTANDKCKEVLNEKVKLINKLDEYDHELHMKRDVINMSFYDVCSNMAKTKIDYDIEYYIDNIETKDFTFLDIRSNLISNYVIHTATIGYDYRKNIWYGLDNFENNRQNKNQFRSYIKGIISSIETITPVFTDVCNQYNVKLYNLDDVNNFINSVSLLIKFKYLSPNIIYSEKFNYLKNNIGKIKHLSEIIRENKEKIENKFSNEFLEYDYSIVKNLKIKYGNFLARTFSSEYKYYKNEIKGFLKEKSNIKYSELLEYLDCLKKYNESLVKFNEYDSVIKEYKLNNYNGYETDFTILEKEILDYSAYSEYGLGFISEYEYNDIVNANNNLSRIVAELEAFKYNLENNLFIQEYFDENIICFKTLGIFNIKNIVGKYDVNFDSIDSWCLFFKCFKQLKEHDLLDFINCALDNNVSINDLPRLFEKIYYYSWAEYILSKNDILATYDRILHDKTVEEFCNRDKIQFAVNKANIKEKVMKDMPNPAYSSTNSAVGYISHEATKSKRIASIRTLLQKTKTLMRHLKPCFLMSPLSVSTFLDPEFKFDVVIFDEASQVFPQDAIGAIYRANQTIIVGDPKQMPPTSFFSNNTDIDEDSEDNITDYESILDKAISTLQSIRLQWHYRSRNEELISFSNKNFYDSSLITIPSAKTKTTGFGVDYYYVKGVYERSPGRNVIEAKKVVELIFENLQKYPERSLGVVAFSKNQQEQIENELYRQRRNNKLLDEAFDKNKNEPFFIKNLETVQGDERDTIIFSIGYGPDATGKIALLFGPLSKEGGERRLNVAVTRAKYNVQVVTSLHSTDIDLTRAKSRGAKLLRGYLDFAERGIISLKEDLKVNEFEQFDSEFELDVCRFLQDKGFEVDTQVGCSSYRIDLCLKRKDTSDYVLAIECDGATYHSSKNARDRDRLRQEILENLGWKFYRIWSTDWFKNNAREKEKLVDECNKALNYSNYVPHKTEKQTEPNADAFFDEVTEIKQDFPKYQMYSKSNIEAVKGMWRSFTNEVLAILKVEAPLSIDWFLRRYVTYFGREKVTDVVREEFDRRCRDLKKNGVLFKNNFMYLNFDEQPLRICDPADARKIEYIPDEELAYGLKTIIKNTCSIQKNELFSKLLKFIGIDRLTDKSKEILNRVLLSIKDEVVIENDLISYNK